MTQLSCLWDKLFGPRFASVSLKRTGIFFTCPFFNIRWRKGSIGQCFLTVPSKWFFDFPFLFLSHLTLLIYPEFPTADST